MTGRAEQNRAILSDGPSVRSISPVMALLFVRTPGLRP